MRPVADKSLSLELCRVWVSSGDPDPRKRIGEGAESDDAHITDPRVTRATPTKYTKRAPQTQGLRDSVLTRGLLLSLAASKKSNSTDAERDERRRFGHHRHVVDQCEQQVRGERVA